MDFSGSNDDMNQGSSSYLALITQTQRLSCRLEETTAQTTWEDALHATSLTLLAKVLVNSVQYLYPESTFDNAINLSFGVKISYVDRANNIFKLKFQHEADCDTVSRLHIWHAKGHLLILKKWSPLTLFAEVEFASTEFWIQIHGLAPITMLKENAINLGNILGKVTDIDFAGNENLILEKYL